MSFMGGAMGSSSNEKKTITTVTTQQGESTAYGGSSMLANVLRSPVRGNLSLTGPTTSGVTVEKSGPIMPTTVGSEGATTTASTSPHLLGLTWTQWAIVGAAALALYWFMKKRKQ